MVAGDVDPWDSQPRTQQGWGTERFPVQLPSSHTLAGLEEEYDGGKKKELSFLCPCYLFLRTKTKTTVTSINDSENSWKMAAGYSKPTLWEARKNLGTMGWVS